MSAAHTPGLLVQDMRGYPHADIKAVSGRKVACTWGINSSVPKSKAAYDVRTAEGRANARSLVACWNAFDGCETELIESVPALGTATLPYRILQARGNALLAAAEAMLDEITGCMASTEKPLREAIEAFKAPRTEP